MDRRPNFTIYGVHEGLLHTIFPLRCHKSLSNTNSTFEDSIVADLAAQCTLVPHQNAIWYDKDGQKLVHYLPHIYSTTTLSCLVTDLHQLLHIFPPRKPAVYEKRSTKFEEWASHLGSPNRSLSPSTKSFC
jgi:hypothetical protein